MKTMKKLAAMLAACGILLSLAGCGDKDKTFTGKAYEKEIMTPGEIVVGISADYPPYESMGTDGKVEGFDVDMANELAKYMGAEGKDVKVTFKNMDFSSIITALQSGQIDVGISAFTYDPERDCLFSDPYLISEQLVVLPKGSTVKSLDELSGKKIGAGTGTTGEKAAKENISGAEVTSPGDYTVMFEALKNGALDAVVCDGQVAKNNAEANGFVIMEEPLVKEENSVIVKKGNDELLKEVNEAVKQFKASDAYVELQQKWGLTEA
ncbi:ABC transporter substrate-binding protein [Neobittarella massiliensis]|uniref:Transporter substrate-binding domain-containing protein n=2 Tax=Oscillospiraceae TaxID=216572 RepID=A0A8J6IQQ7_9FIRM|nr:transporter substrate-binding domain-containing protein [Neobittarella massiliensis]MBC3517300.1 transporter substrate-binding domain-containing protein [Neobittarella massiliensis]SCJ75452.1 Sulfate starvation-induced protein 7 [uncultured Anaerotruncus sp.]